MANSNPIDLSSFFQTKAEANDFSARLAAIVDKMFYTTFNLEKALMEQFGIVKKDALIGLFRDNNISIDSTQAIKNFITQIQETITNLSVVPITLAFEPQEQTLKMLSEWFMINIKKQVLFDLSVDRKMIAGIAITYNGKFKDFSIKPLVETTIQKILAQPAAINAVRGPTLNTEDMHVGR